MGHIDELLPIRSNFEALNYSKLNLTRSQSQKMVELLQRSIDWIEDLMAYKLRGLAILGPSILKLNDPYLKGFPLDHYIVSIMETVSTKDWLQKVDLAFHVKVRGDR